MLTDRADDDAVGPVESVDDCGHEDILGADASSAS
jgi:hypothetical protein